MRVLATVLLVLVLLSAGLGASAYHWLNHAIYSGQPESATTEVTVPKGATVTQVGNILIRKGLVRDPLALRVWLKLSPEVAPPKAGRHRVQNGSSVAELFSALSKRPLPEDVPVTLVEGWRLRDADAFLSAAGRIAPGEYLRAASSTAGYAIPFPVEGRTLAGYLLPDTYLVSGKAIDARMLVQRQIEAFASRFWRPRKEQIKKSGRSLRTVVIMASLLEREEPKPEVRPEVAGVLFNRLDANTPLGVDATSRFTLDDWSDRRAFLRKLRDPSDPWNTRLKAGLPPGPIGAPSLSSLVAALKPQPTKYWYYLHDKQKRIHFSRTAEEHEAKRHKYNVW